MRRGGDAADDDVRAFSPGLKPWWRSVGFWLGLMGAVFLVWVWVNSFTYVPVVSSGMRVKAPGFMAETGGRELRLQRGMVIYYEGDVVVATPGVVVTRDPLRFSYLKGGYRFFGKEKWGYESMVRPLSVATGGVALQSVQCWVPFGFVVAGYVVVWVGWMMVWRWWVRSKGVC